MHVPSDSTSYNCCIVVVAVIAVFFHLTILLWLDRMVAHGADIVLTRLEHTVFKIIRFVCIAQFGAAQCRPMSICVCRAELHYLNAMHFTLQHSGTANNTIFFCALTLNRNVGKSTFGRDFKQKETKHILIPKYLVILRHRKKTIATN